ncbi:DoxX family protein [Mucilaginibacter sp. OK098]|uniref:DoxX family protein n=1 Tax=Mucilaginibacter sp. OK098 TaxID=1855297 RepID=UPI0009189539|nr:DoxX family protein [Mucilaginibacter sp. OK098]SHM82029.1 putative oxidoreductase [Mucilaginibacter sp. OK098]
MAQNWLITPSTRSDRSLDIVRIVVALVLSVHSIYRIIAGDVTGFGEYLGSIGFPLGVALAWLITLSTLASSVALIIRRMVVPACICHMIVLFMGILLDHMHDGWFVVGGGRNGMEYSVVLIACLFAILWSYWPKKQ